MGTVIPFTRPPKKPSPDKTLCREGFHKWQPDKHRQFDVKKGKLVTLWVCARCGKTKVDAR